MALLVLWAPLSWAQGASPPAHVTFAEGSASLERDQQVDPLTIGALFLPGDRLSTAVGRVEILLPDESTLAIDEYSSVELLSPTLLRLTSGRIILGVSGASDPSRAVRYQVDTPVASASTEGPGEYRMAVVPGPGGGSEAELAVFRGWATLRTEQGATLLRAGERSLARDFAPPSPAHVFNAARLDAFDQWAAWRRDARVGTAQSAQYLPRDLRMYGGVLDRSGAWQYEAAYGYVWYPAVAPSWRPYYNGYWSAAPLYGWTWIGLDVWGWPTHHYGRWGFSHAGWFWIPGRRWGPAWVTWAAAPGFVSWCPLGLDNRAVFALSVNVGNPWQGWVVVPRSHFGAPGALVHRQAVARLPAALPVVQHTAAPVIPRAVPRTAARTPLGADVAVPRASASEIAVARGSGYAAFVDSGATSRRSPRATSPRFATDNPTTPRQEVGAGDPRSRTSPDFATRRANRAESGLDPRPDRASGTPFREPLSPIQRQYPPSPEVAVRRGTLGNITSRAGDRSALRSAGASAPPGGSRYGGFGHASPPVTPNSPTASLPVPDRAYSFPVRDRAYSRGAAVAPAQPSGRPLAPVVPSQPGPPARWRSSPTAQGVYPMYAPAAPAPAQQPVPASPSPGATPRASGPGIAPTAVPRGAVTGQPEGPRGEGRSQARAPSSRRGS